MSCLKALVPLAVCVFTVSTAFAQNQNLDPNQPQTNQQQNQFGGQAQAGAQNQTGMSTSDQQIAAWLVAGNRDEIELAKLAQQHAKSKDVRDFAEQMIKDHSQYIEQLQRFAGSAGGQANQQLGAQQNGGQQFGSQAAAGQQPFAAGQPANQTLTSSITNQPQAGGMSQGLNFMTVLQQIGQQCEQSMARELGEKHGTEFDKAFVGSQMGGHMHMMAQIHVLRQYASPQLQQVLAQGEQTTQKHFDHLKHLIKSLESDKS